MRQTILYDGSGKHIPAEVVYEGAEDQEKIQSAIIITTDGDYTTIQHQDYLDEQFRYDVDAELKTTRIPNSRVVQINEP